MATDIAKIGFAVETSQLEKGISTLSTFSTSAKSANSNAQAIGTAMNKAAVTFAGAVAGMSRSIASLVSSTKTATVEEIAAAKEASNFANSIYRAAQAQDTLTVSTQKTTRNLQNMYSAMLKAASSESILNRINRVTGVTGLDNRSAKISAYDMKRGSTKEEWEAAIGGTPRDMMPNRFNTANIAAQFQDIAVTATMGMNPLLIAMQQGSQIAQVMTQMEAPLRGLADAFKQFISTTTFVSVALTGLAAALIQMVDWSKTADSALTSLSSSFDFVTEHVEGFTAALIGLTAAGIITTFSSLGTVVSNLGKVLGPVITFFTKFVKIIGTALTSKFTIIASVITGLVYGFSKLRSYLEDTLGFDITFGLWDKLTSLIKKATDALKEFFNVSDTNTEGWDKISQGITEELDKLQEKHMSLSMTDKESDEFLKRMELYRQAVKEGVNLNDNYGLFNKSGYELIDEYAKSYANWNEKIRNTEESIRNAEKALEAWNNLLERNNQNIESSKLERRLIGVDTYTSEYEKTRQDMINKAIQGGINVTDVVNVETGETYLDKINESADSLARTREETEKLNDVFNTSKSITNSFFQDMRTGLRDGASAWEAFGNAALNVLDNILSKMMDVGVDYMFNAMSAAGWFSGNSAEFSTASGGFDYAGYDNAFNAGMADAGLFAKGGAFTNGVYNSPTLFKFANGGQFGVMGEAGPEAVMPLRRGPDGSLGVDADGVAGGNVVVNIINNSNAQATVNQRETRQGTEIDVLIDQTVAQKMTQQGSYSNAALNAYNNRRLVMR